MQALGRVATRIPVAARGISVVPPSVINKPNKIKAAQTAFQGTEVPTYNKGNVAFNEVIFGLLAVATPLAVKGVCDILTKSNQHPPA